MLHKIPVSDPSIDPAADSRSGERGQGMVEYGLILVLIAIVVIVVLIVLGNQVQNLFCNISAGLNV